MDDAANTAPLSRWGKLEDAHTHRPRDSATSRERHGVWRVPAGSDASPAPSRSRAHYTLAVCRPYVARSSRFHPWRRILEPRSAYASRSCAGGKGFHRRPWPSGPASIETMSA